MRTTKAELTFLNGPYDGWVVASTPEFRKHYYVPIVDNKFHHYECEADTYVYRGEVVVR